MARDSNAHNVSIVSASAMFPLTIHSSGRYLVTSSGIPRSLILDTSWEPIQQLLPAQMDTYLDSVVTRGFTGVFAELFEHAFADNPPNTIDGLAPFPGTPFAGGINAPYLARARYFIQGALNRNLVVLLFPVYVGLGGGTEGWWADWSARTQAQRLAFAQLVANSLSDMPNIMWAAGGDWTVSSWGPIDDLVNGVRSILPGSIWTYHAERGTVVWTNGVSARSWWLPGKTLNSIYTFDTGQEVAKSAVEYARTLGGAPVPFFLLETYYDDGPGSGGETQQRRSICQTIFSGGCGFAYGNNGYWNFGAPGFDQNFASHYTDPGRLQVTYLATLDGTHPFYKLQPRTDTSLVTTALGSGLSAICPAIASDSTYACIYTPGANNFTLNKGAFSTAFANIRIRRLNPQDGVYTTVTSSTPTSGTQAITVPGESIYVVDGSLSALSQLVQSMISAGTRWAQLFPTNLDAVLGDNGATQSLLPYANKVPWNPITNQIEIVGGDHKGATPNMAHVRYDEATNNFVVVQSPPAVPGIGHINDHSAVNPTTGDLYHRMYGDVTFNGIRAMRKTLGAGTFSSIPNSPTGVYDQNAYGTCWWSGAFTASGGHGAQGSFFVYDSGDTNGRMLAFDPLSNTWFLNQANAAPGNPLDVYLSVMDYSVVKNVAVYGGGNGANTRLWKMTSNGTVTAMPNTPTGKTVGIQSGLFVCDPVTGNFLLLSAGQLWELNPDGAGTWTQQTGNRVPPAAVGIPGTEMESIVCALPEHGVVAYITKNGSPPGTFYIYRHA